VHRRGERVRGAELDRRRRGIPVLPGEDHDPRRLDGRVGEQVAKLLRVRSGERGQQRVRRELVRCGRSLADLETGARQCPFQTVGTRHGITAE
jgi:hypothetical protein